MSAHLVMVGQTPIRIAEVVSIADGKSRVLLDPSSALRHRIRKGVEMLAANGLVVYGMTTGVGASAKVEIPDELQRELPLNILRFHGCGTGKILDDRSSAAVVAARLASVCRGYSGMREEVLQRLSDLLNARVLPRIPEEGSVGASGDLTPLSYLAAMLVGEREVSYEGKVMSAGEAHQALGLTPLVLLPKESLALMNGTSFMTGLACLAFESARRLTRLGASLTALASQAISGNAEHFASRLFELKPFRGQALCAQWIREDLEGRPEVTPARLQDRYSVRCAPHVLGVLADALLSAEPLLTIELNSVNDNPIVDPDSGQILHGGNFYGGHVCFVMDGLKAAIANVADLLDRQLLLLCDPHTSDGLPENLVGVRDSSRVLHHGFKAMQITTSALAAEALKLAIPASIFSRSTELHNQDKVSMGSIAARDCLRIIELTETVAAIAMLAAVQAIELRGETAGYSYRAKSLLAAVRGVASTLEEDRRQDVDIAKVLGLLRSGALTAGDHEPWEMAAFG